MPYPLDDERFYQIKDRGADKNLHYSDQMAEENAKSIREMGDLNSRALQGGVDGYMTGRKFKTDMNAAEQRQRVVDSEEARSAAQEGRNVEDYNYKKDTDRPYQQKLRDYNIGEQESLKSRHAMEDSYRAQPVGAEEASKYGYKGQEPLTRGQLQLMMGDQTSAQNLSNQRLQGNIYQDQLTDSAEDRKNKKLQSEIDALVSQPDVDPAQAQAQRQAKVQDASKTLGISLVNAERLVPPVAAPQQAGSAEALARKYKADPQLVQAKIAKAKQDQLTKKSQTEQANETTAMLNPYIKDVREQALQIKDGVKSLNELKSASQGGYSAAAGSGLIGKAVKGLGGDPNKIPFYQSGEQSDIREKADIALRKMDEPGLAAEVSSWSPETVESRMDDVMRRAATRQEDKLRILIQNNPSLRNDREVVEANRALQEFKLGLKQPSNKVDLANPGNTAGATSRAPTWAKPGQVTPQSVQPPQQPTAPQAPMQPVNADPYMLEQFKKNNNQPATSVRR